MFVFLGLALGAWMLTVQPVGAQETAVVEYPENGTGPVATFTAEDPEGDTITWSVTGGADSTSFTFADPSKGTLTFNNPPDYEASESGLGGGDSDNDNTYEVVVTATDTANTPNTKTHNLNVKVTNVSEPGKITWTTGSGAAENLVQFQVGATLTVAATGGVTDGDVRGTDKDVTERLQWYRSPSKISEGTAIDGANSATYTVTTEDNRMYLRVEAFYNVGTGREESVSLTSEYPVLASRSSNTAPKFSPAAVNREISEGKKGRKVGAPVTATDDISNALTYSLGGSDANKFEIDRKTGQIKTMVDLNHEAGNGADDNCTSANACVVTVTATDSAGESSTAKTVNIKITNVDEKPTFSAGPTTASVAENATEVDSTAYAAADPEGGLVNWSLMGADGSLFSLSSTRMLSFKKAPDFEKPTDRNKDNVYEVTVRATAGTMYDDRMVKVTVTDVNEAPEIMGKDTVSYLENGTGPVATFTAEDPEGDTITWSVTGGADSTSFTFADPSKGTLTFNNPPDYEASESGLGGGDSDNDNTYEVVVTATDTANTPNTKTHNLNVKVTNVSEPGKITWTTGSGAAENLVQFQVGATLTASATDGDIAGSTKDVANNITWQWNRGSTVISSATTNAYTVTTEDENKRLRVMVSYTVGTAVRQESVSLTSEYPVLASRSSNTAPKFSPAAVNREISEGKKGRKVGAPVTATDDISNALTYSLGGSDANKFEIDRKTGQIKTMVDLNHEAGNGADDNCTSANACVVTVTATDSAGESSTAKTVNIKITNVDEKPTFSAGPTTASVAENATEVDSTAYAAADPEGGLVNWSLMGADGSLFSLSSTRMLSFKKAPDFEKPTDRNKDNVYEVTVRATAGTMYDDRMVKVTVTDVNEAPEIIQGGLFISGPSSRNFSENGTDAVGEYRTSGSMKDKATWTLEGDDSSDFMLEGSGMSVMLKFRAAPNYEMPADANKNNVYMVTVKSRYNNDNMDMMHVTVTVTDVNEPGSVTLSPMQPRVGSAITAKLNDDDLTGEESITAAWKWAKSMTKNGTFTDIAGATAMMYTPMEADDGYYLKVMVTYNDDHAQGIELSKVTSAAVTSNSLPAFATETATREVAENTAADTNIGAPVTATDADTGDTLTYALGGADAASFAIDTATGQIKTKAALDYEMPRGQAKSDTNTNAYKVTVTATDGKESASIEVTINATDVDESTPLQRYAGEDGVLQLEEVYAAIDDYFDNGADALTLEQLYELIDLYFES